MILMNSSLLQALCTAPVKRMVLANPLTPMKDFLFLVWFALVFPDVLFSQTFPIDRIIIQNTPSCDDIGRSAASLIQTYFTGNETDSLDMLLNYWEKECGPNEAILRVRILMHISGQSFHEESFDSTLLRWAFRYINRIEASKSTDYQQIYQSNKQYFSFIPLRHSFDFLTKNMALLLLGTVPKDSEEYLFCLLYSDAFNEFLELLQSPVMAETKIAGEYRKEAGRYLKLLETSLGIGLGAWIPTGNVSVLGVHPSIDLFVGLLYKRLQADLLMSLRFLRSPAEYTVIYNDTVTPTDHFLGGFIGINAGVELFRIRRHEMVVTGGFGWDGFDAISGNSKKNEKGKTIGCLNLNLGIAYKFHFKGLSYLGFSAKYNFVNYKNPGATDLRGNTITLGLCIGFAGNRVKKEGLEGIGYKGRW
jgi:hypothetical protein